ncbi:hypothetical protein D9M71_252860 [compost metagenome]
MDGMHVNHQGRICHVVPVLFDRSWNQLIEPRHSFLGSYRAFCNLPDGHHCTLQDPPRSKVRHFIDLKGFQGVEQLGTCPAAVAP